MPELTKDNGGPTEAARVFSWNAPKKAVNPFLDPAEVAPVTAVFIDGNSAMAYYPDGTNEYNPNPSTGTLLQTYTAKAALGSAMFGSETRPRNVAFNYIVRAA